MALVTAVVSLNVPRMTSAPSSRSSSWATVMMPPVLTGLACADAAAAAAGEDAGAAAEDEPPDGLAGAAAIDAGAEPPPGAPVAPHAASKLAPAAPMPRRRNSRRPIDLFVITA